MGSGLSQGKGRLRPCLGPFEGQVKAKVAAWACREESLRGALCRASQDLRLPAVLRHQPCQSPRTNLAALTNTSVGETKRERILKGTMDATLVIIAHLSISNPQIARISKNPNMPTSPADGWNVCRNAHAYVLSWGLKSWPANQCRLELGVTQAMFGW